MYGNQKNGGGGREEGQTGWGDWQQGFSMLCNAQTKFSVVGQATMTKVVYYLLAEACLAQ